jgi:hypothetical protein
VQNENAELPVAYSAIASEREAMQPRNRAGLSHPAVCQLGAFSLAAMGYGVTCQHSNETVCQLGGFFIGCGGFPCAT